MDGFLNRYGCRILMYLAQKLRIRHDDPMGNRFEIVILSLAGSALLQINPDLLKLLPVAWLNSLLIPVALAAAIFFFFPGVRRRWPLNLLFGPGGRIEFDKNDERCFSRRVADNGYANYHVAVHVWPGREDCVNAQFELVDLRRVEKGKLGVPVIARPLSLKWFEHDSIGYEPATLNGENRAVIAHLEADGDCFFFDLKPGSWPPHQEELLRNIPHGIYKLTVRIAGNYTITQDFRLHWFGSPKNFAIDPWQNRYGR